jgi:AcrR family transcriptional regulator
LLDTAAAMFAEKPYEDVPMEGIAARAGVSRALLYHYFPSKRDLYLAILKRASGRFLAHVGPHRQLPLAEQLASGLESHIQSFVDHPFEAIAINRGALSDDPAVQAIIAEELNVVGQRLISQLVAAGWPRDATEIAVEGWLAFVRAACVKWIQSQNISRADLTEMCLRAFDCALGTPTSRGTLDASPILGRDHAGFCVIERDAVESECVQRRVHVPVRQFNGWQFVAVGVPEHGSAVSETGPSDVTF